ERPQILRLTNEQWEMVGMAAAGRIGLIKGGNALRRVSTGCGQVQHPRALAGAQTEDELTQQRATRRHESRAADGHDMPGHNLRVPARRHRSDEAAAHTS